MLSLPDFKEKILIIVFAQDGERLSLKNDNLIVTDKEDEIKLQLSCYKILAIWIVGAAVITSGILQKSKKFAFPVLLLSFNFKSIGVWNSPTEGNFLLRKQQYDYHSLDIARVLVINKINNQLRLLRLIRNKEDADTEAVNNLEKYKAAVNSDTTLNELLGLEGISSRIYFQRWFQEHNWQGRSPRTKIDIINLLLDMGYTYLFYFLENMLNLYGFDLYKGVYHQFFFQRKSLVCDLQEPFRCLIDRQIKKSFNLKQINPDDFIKVHSFYSLSYKESKKYCGILLQAILERKEDIFLYCQDYYRSFIRCKEPQDFPEFEI